MLLLLLLLLPLLLVLVVLLEEEDDERDEEVDFSSIDLCFLPVAAASDDLRLLPFGDARANVCLYGRGPSWIFKAMGQLKACNGDLQQQRRHRSQQCRHSNVLRRRPCPSMPHHHQRRRRWRRLRM